MGGGGGKEGKEVNGGEGGKGGGIGMIEVVIIAGRRARILIDEKYVLRNILKRVG